MHLDLLKLPVSRTYTRSKNGNKMSIHLKSVKFVPFKTQMGAKNGFKQVWDGIKKKVRIRVRGMDIGHPPQTRLTPVPLF